MAGSWMRRYDDNSQLSLFVSLTEGQNRSLATTSSSLGALVIIDDRSSQDGVGPVDSAAGRE